MNLQSNTNDIKRAGKRKLFHLFTAVLCLLTVQGWGQAYTITWTGNIGNTNATGTPTGITVTQQYNGVQGSGCSTGSNGATTSYTAKLTAAAGYDFTITSIGGSAYASNAGSRNFSVNLVNGSFNGTGPVTAIGSSSSCGGNDPLTAYSIPSAGQLVPAGTTVTITVLRAPGSATGGGYSWTRTLTVTGVVSPAGSGSNSITTGAITGSPFCVSGTAGAAVSVPFTSTGTFTGNYSVQLSDATGAFANTTSNIIGTGATSPISATIPAATAAGTTYKVRVLHTSPATTGTASTNLTVAAPVTPSVSVAVGATGTTICEGTSVTITATPSNEGATPMYQWKKNGGNDGAPTSSATYTSTTLANNDNISVELTSSLTCVTSTTVTSPTPVAMLVTTKETPSVTVSAGATGTTVCEGTAVTFTATPVSGGTPTYQWMKNGLPDGAPTSVATYSPATLANNDKISVELTTSLTCVTTTKGTSPDVTMTVTPKVTPSVGVAVGSTGTTICGGTNVTVTATPANGGTTPMYQWQINGTNQGAPTASNTYSSTTLANNDKVSVVLTSSDACVTTATATSTDVTMTVNPNLVPGVTVAAGSAGTTICVGTQVTFTATPANGGTTPMYQWKLNGTNQGAPTATNTYQSATLANNDKISVELASSETCLTQAKVTSTDVTMTVNQKVTPSVTLVSNAPNNTLCEGTTVTFTATPNNAGTTGVTYVWKKGITTVGGSGNTYTDNTLANGEQISVTVNAGITCVTQATAISSPIAMIVNQNLTPAVSIAANPGNSICEGTNVTFTATPANGGTAPVYQWMKGTNVIGTNSNTYTDNTLVNGDVISVTMASNETCLTQPTATDDVAISVSAKVIPTAIINAYPGTTVSAGTSVTFSATLVNGGTTPTYQWQNQNGNIVGATNATYTTTTYANNDVISCLVHNDNNCAISDTTRSNSLVMKIKTTGIGNVATSSANLSLYPNPNKGAFTIEADVAGSDNAQVEVLNAIGQVVYQNAIPVNNGKLNGTVNLSGMKQGIYILRLHAANSMNVIRFVIAE